MKKLVLCSLLFVAVVMYAEAPAGYYAAAKKGMVSLGSKVDFEDADTGESFTYEIVGTTEADVEQGRISNESPIGNALLQHKAGDKVRIVVPSGILNVIVKKVY